MYILNPVIHETIWGGKKLQKYVNVSSQAVGHLYMVNGRVEMSNKVINGKYRGKTLREVFDIQKTKWKMDKYNEFPLTIALVDASDNLSIQVHPDDETVWKLEGIKKGKTESWLFLEAPDNGWIYGGCNSTSKEQIKNAIHNNKMEEATGRIDIQFGDYVCIEAGVLHAMTAGCFVYEIEYGSDYTYRFYDYERKDETGRCRELHLEKAVCAIKPDRIPIVKQSIKEQWISENAYEIMIMKDISEYCNTGNELECLSILNGSGIVEDCVICGGMSILLLPGEKVSSVKINDAVVARLRN